VGSHFKQDSSPGVQSSSISITAYRRESNVITDRQVLQPTHPVSRNILLNLHLQEAARLGAIRRKQVDLKGWLVMKTAQAGKAAAVTRHASWGAG
jgi:hypothetical protein